MFLRVYTDEDGLSCYEELEVPSGPDGFSPIQAAKIISFQHQEPGRFVDWHNAKEPTYFITLSGQADLGFGNNEWRRISPGDMTLVEDLTGQGHRVRVVGSEPRVFARIVLA